MIIKRPDIEAVVIVGLIIVLAKAISMSVNGPTSTVEDCVVKISSYRGYGTGIIIHESGIIVTAGHVFEGVGIYDAKVHLQDGTKLKVIPHLSYASPDRDVAFIKVETDKPLPIIEMGNITDFKTGDKLTIIGHPLRESNWHNYGHVAKPSEHGRINISILGAPGYSGGPIIDENNRLVGIVICGALGTGITQGTGIDLIKAVYQKYQVIYGSRIKEIIRPEKNSDSSPERVCEVTTHGDEWRGYCDERRGTCRPIVEVCLRLFY